MAYTIKDNCVGCTACTKRCPTGAISGDRKTLHEIDPGLCIDCGACGVVCPEDCIYDTFGNQTFMLKKTERPMAFVDEQACTGCDKCTPRCPFDALDLVEVPDPDRFSGVMTVNEKNCTGCHECEKACPYDAIFVYRKDQVPEWISGSTVTKLTELKALANCG